MIILMRYIFIGILILYSFACKERKPNTAVAIAPQGSTSNTDTSLKSTIVMMQDTSITEDTPVNDYLLKELQPIRANFKRINAISQWTRIVKKDLEETTEMGEAGFYFLGNQLEKISEVHYGETFQQRNEYYFLGNQLSFVFEKLYKYNRPIYYDTVTMKENNDTEAFDLSKSEIEENRSYFKGNKLIHQINSQDCGSPFSDKYLQEEQQRIESAYKKLRAHLRN